MNFHKTIIMPSSEVVSINDALQVAMMQHEKGRLRRAAIIYERVLQADPKNADALHLNGVVCHQLGDSNKAVDLIKKAILLNPGSAMYYNNISNVYIEMNMPKKAIASSKMALNINPDMPDALYAMARAYISLKCLADAEKCLNRFFEHQPDNVDAYALLTEILCRQGRAEVALKSCQKALLKHENNRLLLINIGNALLSLSRYEDLVSHYQCVVSKIPDFPEARNNLANALCRLGKIDDAIGEYKQSLRLNPDYLDTFSSFLMAHNYISDLDAEYVFERHKEFGKRCEKLSINHKKFSFLGVKKKNRIRIGYVSSDFRQHAVAHFFEPVIKNFDREFFEVFCYSCHEEDDDITKRIKACSTGWRSIVNETDERAAALIKKDEIDILIDLNGHSSLNRLFIFALKPAPIQVTWLGYPNTTGLKTIDYRITDKISDPVGMTDMYYTEKLIRLPSTFSCYQPPANVPDVAELPAKKNGYVTFGSFNNLAKITDEVLALWADILCAIPDAKLVLKDKILEVSGAIKHIRNLFRKRGLADTRLVIYAHSKSICEHFQYYNNIDIALDPFPYNGTTTTCDALWMGVPVITLEGSIHVSRVGVSQLKNLSMDDFIAMNKADYLNISVQHSLNIDNLAAIRRKLRQRMKESKLTDYLSFTRDIEKAYLNIYEDYHAGIK